MIRTILIVTLLIVTKFSFGQSETNNETYLSSNLYLITLGYSDCDKIYNLIQEDIQNNSIFILLQSGISPIVYSTDIVFEKKYNLHFIDEGCVSSFCAKEYNFLIFDYLYKTFGKKWMKEIRKDAIGFKEWKKQL